MRSAGARPVTWRLICILSQVLLTLFHDDNIFKVACKVGTSLESSYLNWHFFMFEFQKEFRIVG